MPSPHGRKSDAWTAPPGTSPALRAPTTTADRLSIIVSVFAAIFSASIAWSSARHLDILWDEQVDLDIAAALSSHPLTGGEQTLDASQMRLPMYLCAMAFRLTGRDDLAVARFVSVILGAVTVIATAAVARICFGPLVACLASLLLGFAPYFLAYERIAMTEGDVTLACFMTLSLWAYLRYLQAPTARRWLVAAIMLGLAVGAKLFAGVLVIVFAILIKSSATSADSTAAASLDVRRLYRLLVAGLAIIAATAAMAMRSREWAVIGWGVLFVVWCYTVTFVYRRRAYATGTSARFLTLVAFAVITFFAVMPVHLTDHQIARDLARRLFRWDDPNPLVTWREPLRLYSGILVTKLTIPWGILTCLALVFSAVRERKDLRWRSLIYSFVFFIAALCVLPLRQTFYLMGVYPIVIIVTAAFVVEIGRWLTTRWPWAPVAWSVLVFAMLGHLGVRVARSYPHYHLYDYAWVGDRWLGAESRGYRNLIQTPSDGVGELIRWCNTDAHVHRGDKVVSYLWEERIIDRLLRPNPHFQLIRRGIPPDSFSVPPPPPIDNADYVLVHINNLLGYGDRPPDWPPDDLLSTRFEVVYTVRRGPLAVAWVYGRRD